MNTTCIWTNPLCLGGKPCIWGHRFSLSQLLAEVVDRPLKEISEDFDIHYDEVSDAWKDLVEQLSLLKINSKFIMSDSETRGGENCVRGTRLPISLVLMELLDGNTTIQEEAVNFDLDSEEVEGLLNDLAVLLDRDWSNGPPENIEKAIREGPHI